MQYRRQAPLLLTAGSLLVAGNARAEDPHDVTTMLAILMDTSQSTIDGTCGGQTYFEHMKDGLLETLADEDVIPRDGRLVLGIMYYGSIGEVSADCPFVLDVVFPFTRIDSETDAQDAWNAVYGSGAMGGSTTLAHGMDCAGDEIALYKPVWNSLRTVLLLIAEGKESTGANVPAVRDDLLDATSGSPLLEEILVLGLDENIAGSPSDPSNPDESDEYIENHIVGPEPFGKVPYELGQSLDSVESFYALSDDACPEDPEILEDFAPRLLYITRLAVHRCSYDISGIPGTNYGDGKLDQSDLGVLLAAYDTYLGDPGYNQLADLDGNGHVFQPDPGVLLANFGCGTKYAP